MAMRIDCFWNWRLQNVVFFRVFWVYFFRIDFLSFFFVVQRLAYSVFNCRISVIIDDIYGFTLEYYTVASGGEFQVEHKHERDELKKSAKDDFRKSYVLRLLRFYEF